MFRSTLLFAIVGIFLSVSNAQVTGRPTGTCSQLINGKYHQVPCSQPRQDPPPSSQQPSGPSPDEKERAERSKKALAAFKDGLRAMELRDWMLAVSKLNEALSLDANNEDYRRALARAADGLRDYETQQKLIAARSRADNTDAGAKLTTLRDTLLQDAAKEKLSAFNGSLNAEAEPDPSAFFYALQTRTLTPMNDGGRPIEIDEPRPETRGMHGLVGGTTWTFGFKWPLYNCDAVCRKKVDRGLKDKLFLFCRSQSDPAKCYAEGLPFDPSLYDMAVSLGSAHTFLDDFATRVIWDQFSYGQFSRKHKEVFAGLKGRNFQTLDCHSNGALVCLAALRSGETTAKEVRLFGPQVSPAAMEQWSELIKRKGLKVTIYINEGDPVPALSWNLPAPKSVVGKLTAMSWVTSTGLRTTLMTKAILESYLDSKYRIMDERLGSYGVTVIRNRDLETSKCGSLPKIECHSMRIYESRIIP